MELRVRVDIPVPPEVRDILAGLREAVRPGGDTTDARATVPAKPFTLVRVIVAILDKPAVIIKLDRAEIVKSITLTVTVIEWERDPLVPRIVTMYEPLVVEPTVRVEVAVPPLVRVTLVELRAVVRPIGETRVERLTVPVKPYRLETAMVEVTEEPARTVRLVGLVMTLKLGGFNGLRLVNLTVAGAEVPCSYSRSSVGLVPVGLRLITWLLVEVSSQLIVAFHDPPASIRM